ncbi:hypothetical protein J1N35_038641 [Gossypium stocksii]|uniref:Trichome birefringence-like N-terminal domain-containing protein n=1 Tax=Gossypium stocksii TaxID=47602 RepID=A0A9D3UMB9_9ROSI|nr:hypothetical protein J1N35_038641 [Gossypium stocksii]
MAATKKLSSLFPLLSLICFNSFFLILSIFKKATISSSTTHPQFFRFKPIDANPTTRSNPSATGDSSCDYSDGSWVYDPNAGFNRYDSSCKEIFKGWNCILNNKSNGRDIINWRWKPRNCDLPPFDPLQFLHTYRDINIGTSPISLSQIAIHGQRSAHSFLIGPNLRPRNYERWAKLADQVLEDPVYKDRIGWEFAENVLSGNNAKGITANDQSSVSLLEISERLVGIMKIKMVGVKFKFELLGTSNGRRLPRIEGSNGGNDNGGIREGKEGKKVRCEDGVLAETRMERRERTRLKKERVGVVLAVTAPVVVLRRRGIKGLVKIRRWRFSIDFLVVKLS